MSVRTRLVVSVQYEAGRKGVPVERSFETWVRAALSGRRRRATEISIALLGTAAARALNRRYRGKDYATNILGFPYEPLADEKTALLGDLVICPAVVAREAREQGKPLRDHYAHLTVHGTLHLLGFDHDRADDAATMEAIERRVLARLGIPDPY